MRFKKLKETNLFKDAETSIKMKIQTIQSLLEELASITDECDREYFLEINSDRTIKMTKSSKLSHTISLNSRSIITYR